MSRLSFGLTIVLALLVSACASGGASAVGGSNGGQPGGGDPLSIIRNKEASFGRRVQAVDEAWRLVEDGKADRQATREALKTAVWTTGVPGGVRAQAVRRLLDDRTPEGINDTRNFMRLRLPTEPDWDVIRAICDGASSNGWTELAPALVRSWSRAVLDPKDDDRPERAALLKLFPQKQPVEIVFGVFEGSLVPPVPEDASRASQELATKARREAWELLGRIDADGRQRRALVAADAGTPTDDPLLQVIRGCMKDLRSIPITASELEWAQGLREPGEASTTWWTQAATAAASLGAAQCEGLRLRHAEPIRWASMHKAEWLAADRGALLAELGSRQNGRRLHERTADMSSNMGWPSGRLREAEPKLVWGDVLAILVVDEALRSEGIDGSLVRQAAADRRDTSCEHGGAIEESGGSYAAVEYPARAVQRMGDRQFVASDEMMAKSIRGLAHYHFHAQRADNSEYAGPGPGDFEYARKHGRTCVVFTSIGESLLDADCYLDSGVVIDLGEIPPAKQRAGSR